MRGRRLLERAWPWLGALLLALVTFRWLFRGEIQAARDLYAQFFPETFVLIERWRALEVPLWLPHERLGQPFLALLYTQVFYPPRVLTGLVFGHLRGPSVMHAFHCLWAFGGAFLALRSTGRSRAGAFVGASAWGFSPFFVELSQNLAFASSAAWAGWTWWAAERLVRSTGARALPWSVARLSLVLGSAFHAGAPEMVGWQALLVVAVAGFSRRPTASLARVFGAFVGAALVSAVVALPAAELVLEWTDPTAPVGGLFAWSMSWPQLGSIAIPDADFPRAAPFFGDDQRFFFTLLLGPASVALALLGARRRSRAVLALACLCAVLALGAHFLPSTWLLQLPPFRFFRFPVKYAAGLLFGLAMLSASGLDRLRALGRSWARDAALHRRELSVAIVGVVGGLVLAALVGGALREGFVTGVRWVALSGAVIALATQLRWRAVLLPAWVTIELLAMPHREWPPEPAEPYAVPSPIAEVIRRERHERVSIRVDMDDPGTPWSEPIDPELEAEQVVRDSRQRLSVLRFLEEDLRSTSGYGFRDPWRLARAFEHGEGAFQLAGVTHFVRNAGAPLRFQGPTPSRTAIDDVWLWRAREAFPRSWVIDRAEVMRDDEAFERLGRSANPPRDFAPVNELSAPLERVEGCTGAVATEELRPEVIHQELTACGRAIVVLADSWFPGWSVEVDGAPARPLRVWGFLRGVEVPAGRHTVEWRYEPVSYRLGRALSVLALAAALAARVWSRRSKT